MRHRILSRYLRRHCPFGHLEVNPEWRPAGSVPKVRHPLSVRAAATAVAILLDPIVVAALTSMLCSTMPCWAVVQVSGTISLAPHICLMHEATSPHSPRRASRGKTLKGTDCIYFLTGCCARIIPTSSAKNHGEASTGYFRGIIPENVTVFYPLFGRHLDFSSVAPELDRRVSRLCIRRRHIILEACYMLLLLPPLLRRANHEPALRYVDYSSV